MARAPRITAGELDQRITLQVRVTTTDALGQASGAWQDAPTNPDVWAKVGFIGARDVAVAGQYQAIVDAKFIIRFRSDITPAWRVVWQGQPFEIIGEPVPVDGGRDWCELRCSKGMRDGR